MSGRFDEGGPLLTEDSEEYCQDPHMPVQQSNFSCVLSSSIGLMMLLLLVTCLAAVFAAKNEEAVADTKVPCLLKKTNSAPCPHETLKIFIPATAENKWPTGLYFVVSEYNSNPSRNSIIYSENGMYLKQHSPAEKLKCTSFVSELCIDGKYILYADSNRQDESTSYVIACHI
jgi:hypothetical protein